MIMLIKDNFDVPTGRIDFITLKLPFELEEEREREKFITALGGAQSRTELPRKITQRHFFTIHDPTTVELQRIIDAYPDLEILALEIAIDFFEKDRGNDPAKLDELRRWLVHRLYPQKHKRMQKRSWRKYYDGEASRIRNDAMRSKGGNTVYWGTPAGHEQVRVYTKTTTKSDGRLVSIETHSVRLEVTLFRGGCQNAGVHRLALLPEFSKRMRLYLSKFLSIGRCMVARRARPSRSKDHIERERAEALASVRQDELNRAWEKYGALWAVEHGEKVRPDSEANRWIGQGLKKLRENLVTLTVPAVAAEKVAEWKGAYETRSATDKGFSEWRRR